MARPKRAMDQVVFDLEDYPKAVTSQVRDRMPVILSRGNLRLVARSWNGQSLASVDVHPTFRFEKDALSRLAVVIPTS